MVRALTAGLMVMALAPTARAEEARPGPSRPAAPGAAAGSPAERVDTAEASCGAQAPAADAAAEERAFSAELESFDRRRVFTARLVAKREAEAFEQAALRQARAAELKRQLTERETAMVEREFEEAVALYLKKRELTRTLSAAASRATPPPADSAGAPTSPPTTPPSH